MDTQPNCPSCGKPLPTGAPMGLCPECLVKGGFATGVESDTESAARPGFVPPAVEDLARLFPQLEILEFIGKGGMGAIYKARQKQLNRIVALKILPPGIGREPAFTERFTREAQALAQLNHPGIVTLYEFGQADGLFYFLMEYVDGMNLRQLLLNGRLSAREALAIVPQICDALQFAHDQGIVHRDIKPENVLLDRRGRVKVADFGLAKLAGATEQENGGAASGSPALTRSGKIVGTPSYMAPEQKAHPGEVDHRADIYALGVVLYQMLTGELPGKPIEPPSKRVQMDVRLDEVILRALEKEPARRYQHVSEIGTDVETISGSRPGIKPQKSMKQPTRLFVMGAVAFCVLFAVAVFAFRGKSAQTLTIRAFIDGSDIVYVSGYKLWIEHEDFGLPGKLIYVNHQAWTPTWSNNISSEFLGLDPPFNPRDPQTIQVTKLGGRGNVSFDQFPSADNDQTLGVKISDDAFGGADWYEIVISWNGNTKSTAAGTRISAKPGAELDAQPAISAAQKWLAAMDAGDYSRSWKEASSMVQEALTQQQFTNFMNRYRKPFGDLISRKLALSQPQTQSPGAPDGQYMFMQFGTSFANKKSAIETVTFILENGQWKMAGYSIK